MRNLIKVLPVVLLCACTKQTPMEPQYVSIQHQIDAVKKTLPAECKTEGVLATLEALSSQVKAERVSCEAAINSAKKDAVNTKLMAAFVIALYSCLIVIAILIKRKLK